MAWLLAVGLPASLALGMLSLTAARRRNDLLASQAELAASFDSAATGTALVDGATGQILKVNRRLSDMTGRDATELNGMTLDQLLDRGETGSTVPEGAAAGLDRLQRPDGSVRWVECATAPVTRTHSDASELVIATLHDITERKESQERQALLAREVDHRAKNVLAIVRAVIRLARDPDAAQFADKIDGRVRALARAHELLARDRWQGTNLADLISDELAPYQDGERVRLSGPAVRIAAASVQPLSMALHELATNAVKHGALARSDGGLSISWSHNAAEGRLELLWVEEAGRAATLDPESRGVGLKVLRGSVEQLGGTVALDWREAGLSCSIKLPMDTLVSGSSKSVEPGERACSKDCSDGNRSLVGTRVLVVEDEIILAMDIKAMLEDLGCEVIGPASTLQAAQALARQEAARIDAAILDVNVKGATTFELARQLQGDGVACVFVTGYSELPEVAEENWLLLRKPVSEREIVAALQSVITPGTARSELAAGSEV
jgi:PAS domain S-box-containing protein